MTAAPDLRCPQCGREARTGPTYAVHCLCGGLWSAPAAGPAEAKALAPDPAAPDPTAAPEVVALWPDPGDSRLWWKREDLNRTGSFKDRGAEVLAATAAAAGAERLVLDSSGSAALAGAAAAARWALPLTVHTPEILSRIKRDALETLGAVVVARGDRTAAAVRAREAAEREFYFSHVHHPAFFEGTARSGAEILRAQTGDPTPRTWVLPVGNGSLLLGLALALARGGREDIRLVAVQAAGCPGLRRPGCRNRTAATGIGICDPPRRDELLSVLRRHQGEIVEVEETEIAAARARLGRCGVAAEPAAAAAGAGVARLRAAGREEPMIAWLTGCGLRG